MRVSCKTMSGKSVSVEVDSSIPICEWVAATLRPALKEAATGDDPLLKGLDVKLVEAELALVYWAPLPKGAHGKKLDNAHSIDDYGAPHVHGELELLMFPASAAGNYTLAPLAGADAEE